jgi:hypothetical protein
MSENAAILQRSKQELLAEHSAGRSRARDGDTTAAEEAAHQQQQSRQPQRHNGSEHQYRLRLVGQWLCE